MIKFFCDVCEKELEKKNMASMRMLAEPVFFNVNSEGDVFEVTININNNPPADICIACVKDIVENMGTDKWMDKSRDKRPSIKEHWEK